MPPNNTATLRLSDLLDRTIQDPHGRTLGHLADVRLQPARIQGQQVLQFQTAIIDRRRPGALFGYDRSRQQGPWILAIIIRRLHRHARLLSWQHITDFDPAPDKTGLLHVRSGYTLTHPDQP